jgi:two-component system phosphate regulon response regulator PhoB
VTVSLLLVSDESADNAFEQELHSLGFRVHRCDSGAAAMEMALKSPPNLILVDARSDPLSSIQLCRSLRSIDETANLPAVVLTGRASAQERLALLDAGADDCWTEPPDSREFLLRLKWFARRFDNPQQTRILCYADIELDITRYKVWRNGVPIELRAMQFKLLRHLMEHPTIIFSRQQLLEQVWENRNLDPGAVSACVLRLRRSLEAAGGPDLIRSVPGAGYALDAEHGRQPRGSEKIFAHR